MVAAGKRLVGDFGDERAMFDDDDATAPAIEDARACLGGGGDHSAGPPDEAGFGASCSVEVF